MSECKTHKYVYASKENTFSVVYHYRAKDCPYCEIDQLRADFEECDKERMMFEEQRDELRAANERLRSYSCEMASELTVYMSACEELKQNNAKMREALEKLARLGNGDEYGNSIGNVIAREALE